MADPYATALPPGVDLVGILRGRIFDASLFDLRLALLLLETSEALHPLPRDALEEHAAWDPFLSRHAEFADRLTTLIP